MFAVRSTIPSSVDSLIGTPLLDVDDLHDLVGRGVVADNQGAHNKMADCFFSDNPGKHQLVVEIAEWFYALANQSRK